MHFENQGFYVEKHKVHIYIYNVTEVKIKNKNEKRREIGGEESE